MQHCLNWATNYPQYILYEEEVRRNAIGLDSLVGVVAYHYFILQKRVERPSYSSVSER